MISRTLRFIAHSNGAHLQVLSSFVVVCTILLQTAIVLRTPEKPLVFEKLGRGDIFFQITLETIVAIRPY